MTESGKLLDWRITGCQLVSPEYCQSLTCPVKEQIWQCEVVGPHTKHEWSDHLMVHERLGNGYSCSSIGDMTLKELYQRSERLTPFHVVGMVR